LGASRGSAPIASRERASRSRLCAAAGFAAAALVEALGDTHRLLAYCLLAVIFVLLAVLSGMLIHRQTAPDHSSRQ